MYGGVIRGFQVLSNRCPQKALEGYFQGFLPLSLNDPSHAYDIRKFLENQSNWEEQEICHVNTHSISYRFRSRMLLIILANAIHCWNENEDREVIQGEKCQ